MIIFMFVSIGLCCSMPGFMRAPLYDFAFYLFRMDALASDANGIAIAIRSSLFLLRPRFVHPFSTTALGWWWEPVLVVSQNRTIFYWCDAVNWVGGKHDRLFTDHRSGYNWPSQPGRFGARGFSPAGQKERCFLAYKLMAHQNRMPNKGQRKTKANRN